MKKEEIKFDENVDIRMKNIIYKKMEKKRKREVRREFKINLR